MPPSTEISSCLSQSYSKLLEQLQGLLIAFSCLPVVSISFTSCPNCTIQKLSSDKSTALATLELDSHEPSPSLSRLLNPEPIEFSKQLKNCNGWNADT